MLANVTVEADGTYILPAVFPPSVDQSDNTNVRIEFGGLPSWLVPGTKGGMASTLVQFHSLPTKDADLALVNPTDDCCDQYPDIVLPCYINGDQSASGAGFEALVKTSSDASIADVNKKALADAIDIGTTWGTVYLRDSETVLSAAVIKRHAGFGPSGGIDTIYGTDWDAGPGNSFVFMNAFSDLGINVGADFDRGDLGGTSQDNHDPLAFDKVAKEGYGDLEYDGNTNTLWFVNLLDRRVYGIANISVATTPTASDIINPGGWLIDTNPGINCVSGELRPWGVRVIDGTMYATGTCTGEDADYFTDDYNFLHGYIFTRDLSDPNAEFETLFDWKFDIQRRLAQDTKAGHWNTWGYCDDYRTYFNTTNPEVYVWGENFCNPPLVSDVDVDYNGDLIIGIMDRTGMQLGFKTFFPNFTTPQEMGRSEGDIIKACWNGAEYVLEGKDGNPRCQYNSAAVNLTDPNPFFGPGEGEFFIGDEGPDDTHPTYSNGQALYHYEVSFGTFVLNPHSGNGEIILSAMDPYKWFSAGLFWLSPESGSKIGAVEFFATQDGNATFAKATGLGEAVLMCEKIPIEIGDRVWNDLDGNGIQDPNEPGIPGVTVTLEDSVSGFTYTTTTDADGYFCFDDAALFPQEVYFHHSYELSISLTDPQLAASGVTTPTLLGAVGSTSTQPSQVDSDSVVDGVRNVAYIEFTTTGSGLHLHHLDFGFVA